MAWRINYNKGDLPGSLGSNVVFIVFIVFIVFPAFGICAKTKFKFKIMLFTDIEKTLKNLRGAIHVGANDGGERDWYIQMSFPKVIYFEPILEVFNRLQEHIKNVKGHYAFNIGIHDTLEKAELNIANNSGQSSSILPLGTHKTHHPKVKYIGKKNIKLVRLDDFMKINNFSIDDFNFLNIDVQGVELNVIKSLGELITKIDYIYTEVNWEELYRGCCLIHQIDDYLKQYGFIKVKVHQTRHMWGDAFYVKKELI